MTQADITNALNALINETPTNAPLSAGGDTNGQCTAPPIKFYEKLGWPTPAMANDSANGWGTNFPAVLAPYVTHQAYQPGVAYPEGTVMMWNSPHIAIVISSDGSNTVKVFEQNADPDGSYPKVANRTVNIVGGHQATYVLIPILTVSPGSYCTYEDTPEKTMLTALQPTKWWNLDNPTSDINNFQPAALLNIDVPFPIGGYAHNKNFPQYTYAMSPADYARIKTGDFSTNNGVNINDLKDIPVIAPPTPVVVPPPIPVPVVPQLINSIPKVQAPDMTPYVLVVDVKSYNSAPTALTRSGVTVTLKAGDYYKFNTLNGMISLTKTPGLNMQWWINPTDNVLPPKTPVSEWGNFVTTPLPVKPAPLITEPPVVTSWKDSYKAFNKANEPVIYKALANLDIDDLDTKRPWLEVDKGQSLAVYGTVTFTDGKIYGRLKTVSDPGTTPTYWYCVPLTDIRTSKALKIVDYIDLGYMKVMDIIARRK